MQALDNVKSTFLVTIWFLQMIVISAHVITNASKTFANVLRDKLVDRLVHRYKIVKCTENAYLRYVFINIM